MKKGVRDVVIFVTIILVFGLAVGISMHSDKKEEASMTVGVHVKGAVKKPGYYELEYGSRIKDAIEIAGGETTKADLENINLAMKLIDGQEVIVELKEEATTTPQEISVADEDNEELMVEDTDSSGKININTADIDLLCELDGIGESVAGAIIEYRTNNGNFASVNEIKNVKGIGESKFDKIKDRITV